MIENLEKFLILTHAPNQSEPWFELEYVCTESIHKFIEFVNTLNNIVHLNQYRQPILFRGQANSKWKLEPKIYRLIGKLPIKEALGIEFDSIIHFKQVASMFLAPQLVPKGNDLGAWLALMQQYGAPTRMLDWTTSFNVALYFAVTDKPIDTPCAVWFFGVGPLLDDMKKYEEPSPTYREEILTKRDNFVEYGCSKARQKIATYDIPTKSERMIVQQSIFTYCEQLFCDHADLIGNSLWNRHKNNKAIYPLIKIVISPPDKHKIQVYLNKLNITAATLFPGIDGIGKSISELIQVYCDVFHEEQKSGDM